MFVAIFDDDIVAAFIRCMPEDVAMPRVCLRADSVADARDAARR